MKNSIDFERRGFFVEFGFDSPFHENFNDSVHDMTNESSNLKKMPEMVHIRCNIRAVRGDLFGEC
jgi:hypothetical protein